ncbi:MAG: hypothetical protein KGS72_18555 [Cyanobacteria bacterium REEB67]|nr:hypothetical protein [Cyanobacteria bacterium REEB67]
MTFSLVFALTNCLFFLALQSALALPARQSASASKTSTVTKADSSSKTAGNQNVTLKFRNDRSVGKIYRLDKNWDIEAWPLPLKYVSEARGQVQVPAGAVLGFRPNSLLAENPEFLSGPLAAQLELLEANNIDMNDKLAAAIGGCTRLKRLNVNGTEFDDKGLAKWNRLINVRKLLIGETLLTGRTLSAVAGMKHLILLDLKGDQLQHGALRAIANLSELRDLFLDHSGICDSDLVYLENLQSIRYLTIVRNDGITDGALKTLATLKNLNTLDLEDTKVTVKGLAATKLPSLAAMATPPSCRTARDLAALHKAFPKAYLRQPNRAAQEQMEFFNK